MAVVIYDIGAFRLLASHLYKKKNSEVWQFRRRIPADVAKHYPGNKSGYIQFSLKTQDKAKAAMKADAEAQQQDALWESYRTGELEHGPEEVKAALALLASYGLKPGQSKFYAAEGIEPDRFVWDLESLAGIGPENTEQENTQRWDTELPPVHRLAADMFYGDKVPVFLSNALKEFQTLKVQDPSTDGEKGRVRVVNEFIGRYGDLPIEQYTRDNANDFARSP
ncbi:DUF6538 domain-containing protein [Tropicimonas sp. IMCC6043]|uniref:DUF6538 domain-containing protein n=1 Tax=Tropicimonas sp. IMCC6043 TaxID=2510645 RepID=UPI00101C364C|nr:DUF6538 domain-containing protein [Tropicimonas sp. IMCC6043]RYH09959.1 hypothetical protein EU800_10445 [Tropicimonas sp. IMCC6043]